MIKIPPDATIVSESRLTLIAAINLLSFDHLKQIKAKVKDAMAEKKADYAQSSLAVARLSTWEKSVVDPVKIYKLVESGKLKIKDFLACVSVAKEPLKAHLSGKEIEALCAPAGVGGEPAGALYVEFKPGVEVDAEKLAKTLIDGVKQQQEDAMPQWARNKEELSAQGG